MSGKELESAERWTTLDNIVGLYLEGNNAQAIARQLRMKVKDVESYITEWRYYVRNNQSIQDRARDSIHSADAHFNKIVKELWSLIDEADQTGNLAAKNIALKTLADTEVKRTSMLDKAGLADSDSMAELMMENEKKVDKIVVLLRRLTSECDHCRPIILEELSKMSDKAEPVIIQDLRDLP